MITARILLLSCLLASSPADAQERHGTLIGRVTDTTGTPLAGVVIRAGEAAIRSAGDGAYRIEGLRPGRYRLTFVLAGFAENTHDGVAIVAGRSTRVDATLHVALEAEVTVSGRSTAASASQGAITGRQLELRPIQRTGDILESVPGLLVTQHSGEGKANQYFLRGFNLDHGTDFQTVLAGMPLNLPTHAHGQGYTDVNLLIPELVSTVEYFKGPYSAEAGDFSSAGGVTIDYANALAAPLVRVTAGGFGWTRAIAAASPRAGGGHLLGAVEGLRNDGPWTRSDDYRRQNAVLRYSRSAAAESFAITGVAYRARWNATDQVPSRAVASGVLPRFGGVDPTSGGTTSRYAAAAEWRRGSTAGRTTVSGYTGASMLDLFSNFTYYLEDPQNGDQFQQADRRLTWGLAGSHERSMNWDQRPIRYRAGVQLRHDGIGRLGLYRTRARRRLSTIREDRVGQTSAAVWSDADVQWRQWLRSVTGARVDGYRFRVTPAGADAATSAAGVISPKASVIVAPSRRVELYVNGGFGFHSNDARAGSAALARSRGAEIGARTELLPGVRSTVSLWRLSLDSELVFVGDQGTTQASRPSRRYGVEWSAAVSVGRSTTIDADIACSRAEFTDDGAVPTSIPNAPGRVAAIGISSDISSRLRSSVRWRYFGSRPLVEDGSVRSPASATVNLQMRYAVLPHASILVDGFNLFDARLSDVDYFYTSRLPDEPAEGVEGMHMHPALPRTLRVTLAFSF